MAHIPAIPLSTRTLVNLPDTYVARGAESNAASEIARLGDAIGKAGHSIVSSAYDTQLRLAHKRQIEQERADRKAQAEAEKMRSYGERMTNQEADIAFAEWDTSMRRATYGWNEVDENGQQVEHKGIMQKGWTDYEGTETSPIKDLAAAEKAYQTENERYLSLSPAARARFDMKAAQRRQEYLERVNQAFDRNKAQKMAFEKGVKDQNDIERVQLSIGASDQEYAQVSADAAIRMTIREMEPLIKNGEIADNPDFNPNNLEFKNGDKGREMFKAAVKERLFGDKGFAAGRITYLTQKAAAGEDVNGVPPEQALAQADGWIDFLARKGEDGKPTADSRITPREEEKLRGVVRQARKRYDGIVTERYRDWADKSEQDLLEGIQKPTSGLDRDMARYHANRSVAYKSIIESPDGKELAKRCPTKFKAFQRMAQNEAADSVAADRKANASKFMAMIGDGWIGDHELTAAEIQATADDLLARGAITQDAYDDAKRAKAKTLTPQAKALHERIFSAKGAKFPEMCKWQENIGRFAIPESKAGTKAAQTPLTLVKKEGFFVDDNETRLYKEYVQAANYALDYMQTKNCTVDQAYAEFQALTLGTEAELAALAYDQRLQRKKDAIDALKRRTRASSLSFAKEVMK